MARRSNMRLLHVDASPRRERSNSRSLARTFIEAWQKKHSEGVVILRDVGASPPPHVTEDWIAGAFAPVEYQTAANKAAIAVSDALVAEFISADLIVISTPMHNLSMPSTLKAYIDHIVRIGKTVKLHPDGRYEGLVTGRRMIIITASGGAYGHDSPFASHNHLDPYLRTIFGFIGIHDVKFVNAELLDAGDDHRSASLARAQVAVLGAI